MQVLCFIYIYIYFLNGGSGWFYVIQCDSRWFWVAPCLSLPCKYNYTQCRERRQKRGK